MQSAKNMLVYKSFTGGTCGNLIHVTGLWGKNYNFL